MASRTRLAAAFVTSVGVVSLLACGGTQTGVTDSTGDGPAAGNPCAPAGNPCATGPRVGTAVASMGKAADATVLAGDGSHVQLASAWLNTTAVIVFYRGHW